MAGHIEVSKSEYMRKFYTCLGPEKARAIQSRSSSSAISKTRAFCHEVQHQIPVLLSDVQGIAQRSAGEGAVIIVENINLDWIAALGVALCIEP
jgi:hypothetical protein